jgi:hypothetical protein
MEYLYVYYRGSIIVFMERSTITERLYEYYEWTPIML